MHSFPIFTHLKFFVQKEQIISQLIIRVVKDLVKSEFIVLDWRDFLEVSTTTISGMIWSI